MKLRIVAAFLLAALAGWLFPAPKTVASQTNEEPKVEQVTSPANEQPINSQNEERPKTIPKVGAVLHGKMAVSNKKVLPAENKNNGQLGGCEEYSETIQKYFGDYADQAIFVATKESGCNMAAVSRTQDYCIFQINREPATGKDLDLCVRRAWEKFTGGRVGSNNWSAWYAVCTPGNDPQPKYSNLKCQ